MVSLIEQGRADQDAGLCLWLLVRTARRYQRGLKRGLGRGWTTARTSPRTSPAGGGAFALHPPTQELEGHAAGDRSAGGSHRESRAQSAPLFPGGASAPTQAELSLESKAITDSPEPGTQLDPSAAGTGRVGREERAADLGRAFTQQRVAASSAELPWALRRRHVRVYHGKHRLPKTHRRPPASTAARHFTSQGSTTRPVTRLRRSAEANAGLVKMLPGVLQEIRPCGVSAGHGGFQDRGGFNCGSSNRFWSPASTC